MHQQSPCLLWISLCSPQPIEYFCLFRIPYHCRSNAGKGTGFIAKLVAPFPAKECLVLVTNNHVLSSIEAAMNSNIYFDRVADEGYVVPGNKLFDTTIWKTCLVGCYGLKIMAFGTVHILTFHILTNRQQQQVFNRRNGCLLLLTIGQDVNWYLFHNHFPPHWSLLRI